MRYLFFDIECCNGRDICEFGYVITDTSFTIIEKEDITINPENKFNLTGRTDGRDLYLSYAESVYYSSPKFPTYYDKIKALIEYEDQIIIGHAIANDAGFLRKACERFGLDRIDFQYYDSQKLFKGFSGERKSVSLEVAAERLGVEFTGTQHKSDDDSELTMLIVKKMCEQRQTSFPGLIEMFPTCGGDTSKMSAPGEHRLDKIISIAKSDPKKLNPKKRTDLLVRFLNHVEPQGEIIPSVFNGKTICISLNYEWEHLKEMFALAQSIVNHGGTYILKASNCDIFVRHELFDEEGNERPCTRLNYVNEAIEAGKSIEIISFEELLRHLGISEEVLSSFPFPDDTMFFAAKKSSSYKKRPATRPLQKEQGLGISIGDLIKAQGLDLDEVI